VLVGGRYKGACGILEDSPPLRGRMLGPAVAAIMGTG